jgi:hypothetical protein
VISLRVGVIEDFLESQTEMAGFLSAEYLPEIPDYFLLLAKGENIVLLLFLTVLSIVKAVSSPKC